MTATSAIVNRILGINDSYKAPERLMTILYDREHRERVFREFLDEAFNYNVNFDWFHEYFQEEHADRAKKKQDFTPESVAKLTVALVGGEGGNHYEPCAGTGGMTISRWHYDRMQTNPFDYLPSDYFYTCEELSDRAFPFLLFNVLIRGMNALVVHCDVLTRKAYGAFFVQNDNDNHLGFSSLNLLPYNDAVERELAVKFVEERYQPILESPGVPKHVVDRMLGVDLRGGVTFKEAMGW